MEPVIRMIFLDIDDTLIDHSGAEKKAAVLFGEKYSDRIPGYNSIAFLEKWKQESNKHFERFLNQELTFQEQRRERIRGIFHNSTLTDSSADDFFNDYLFAYQSSWKLFDDVLPFLQEYKDQGIAIISDGGQEQQEKKLSDTGILDFFQLVVTAESSSYRKPQGLIFEYAARKVKHKIEDCIYIGDNLEKDAIGASNAGMKGLWLNRNSVMNEYSGLTISTLGDYKNLND